MGDQIIMPPRAGHTAVADTFPESGGPCEDCAHSIWDPDHREAFGQCRKESPVTQIMINGVDKLGRPVTSPISAWPIVGRRQGCGQFAAKKGRQN